MGTRFSNTPILRKMISAILLGSVAACGGGGGSSMSNMNVAPASVAVPVVISDGPSRNWAMVGVKVLSISLIPQGGGAPVSVYSASVANAPTVNLIQLDGVAELLGNVTVPAGTYTGAQITLSANPGDVTLSTNSDPDVGFPAPANTAINPSQIQIGGTAGSAGSQTVAFTVNFTSPITASSAGAIDLDFDIGHPAFLIDHALSGGSLVWAVNFDSHSVRHHPVGDITKLVLRHTYGTVTAIAAAAAGAPSTLKISKVFPTHPIVSPETDVQPNPAITLTFQADSTNGTVVTNLTGLTAATPTTPTSALVKDFTDSTTAIGNTNVNALLTSAGATVRVRARYQGDGTLVATHVWVSDAATVTGTGATNAFNDVWVGPEGHVLHVEANQNVLFVTSDGWTPEKILVDPTVTTFSFHGTTISDPTSNTLGTTPLAALNIRRGFKVTATGGSASTPATTLDIETADFNGPITPAPAVSPPASVTYSDVFNTVADDFGVTLPFVSTAYAQNLAGQSVKGFQFWDFAYPSVLSPGSSNSITPVAAFQTATSGTLTIGNATLFATGRTHAIWGDPSLNTPSSGWYAPWAILEPTQLPRAVVTTAGLGTAINAVSPLSVTFAGASAPTTINVSASSGSATLVYVINRTNNQVTVKPLDITQTNDLATLNSDLSQGTTVRIFGVPQATTPVSINAYVLAVFTGDSPSS